MRPHIKPIPERLRYLFGGHCVICRSGLGYGTGMTARDAYIDWAGVCGFI